MSGDRTAQAQVGNIATESVKQIGTDMGDAAINAATTTLEATAQTAGFVSDASGKIALGAATVGRGDVAAVSGTVSTLAGVTEVGALLGKAALTGNQRDLDRATQKGGRLGASMMLGQTFSVFRNSDPLKNTAIMNQVLDFSSYIIPQIYSNTIED
jgi:hypothetical protein